MKVTWSAKPRIKTDIVDFFFQGDSSMDLAFRMIWRFGRPMKLDTSSFSVKSQSAVLHLCHLTNFAKETKETNFSVKSSWEVHWIIMFQKDAVWHCARLFAHTRIFSDALCSFIFVNGSWQRHKIHLGASFHVCMPALLLHSYRYFYLIVQVVKKT